MVCVCRSIRGQCVLHRSVNLVMHRASNIRSSIVCDQNIKIRVYTRSHWRQLVWIISDQGLHDRLLT